MSMCFRIHSVPKFIPLWDRNLRRPSIDSDPLRESCFKPRAIRSSVRGACHSSSGTSGGSALNFAAGVLVGAAPALQCESLGSASLKSLSLSSTRPSCPETSRCASWPCRRGSRTAGWRGRGRARPSTSSSRSPATSQAKHAMQHKINPASTNSCLDVLPDHAIPGIDRRRVVALAALSLLGAAPVLLLRGPSLTTVCRGREGGMTASYTPITHAHSVHQSAQARRP